MRELSYETYLRNVSWGFERDSSRCGIKLLAIQLEELHENFTEVMLRDHVSALDLWHVLEQTYNKTSYREAANTTVDWLVKTSHTEQMFDQSDEDGHGRELCLPIPKGFDGD